MGWRTLWHWLRHVSEMVVLILAVAIIGWGVVAITFGIPLIYKTLLRVEAKLSVADAACASIKKDQERIK